MRALLASSGNAFATFITEYFGIDSWVDVLLIVLDIAIITFLIYETIKIFTCSDCGREFQVRQDAGPGPAPKDSFRAG